MILREDLGLQDRKMKLKLYKLLIYPEGGHFDKHRDSEKESGMFGTLVVQLPSIYEGGELCVSHNGKERKLCFSGMEGTQGLNFIAFYADCYHEISKVTEGFRTGKSKNFPFS